MECHILAFVSGFIGMGLMALLVLVMTGHCDIGYTARWNCKACKERLTNHQMMYSDGVCPKCGAISKGTIVSCDKSSVNEG